jgi:dihydropteroate synthase
MFTLNCNGRLLIVENPIVMGIINITPDSFYSGSRFEDTGLVLKQAEKMLKEGAAILDIGGQSSRPGSHRVGIDEELKRVITAINEIHRHFPEAFISTDTFYAKVAEEAVAAGASIVNDISAGGLDENMIGTVASLNVPYILMHMKGKPENMQSEAHYENVTTEVLDFFISRIPELRKKGIKDLIIDPGFGFGKTIRHNFTLLHDLSLFKILGLPLLAGLSRKSTIYKTLGITAEESQNGTTAMNTIALLNGASILRVHDVRQAKEAVMLVKAYQNSK